MGGPALPSFQRHAWTPPLPPNDALGLSARVVVEEGDHNVPIWVLAGSYRVPPGAVLPGEHPLAALVVVAINRDGFNPLVRQLAPALLVGAQGELSPAGDLEGTFALNLAKLFSLRNHSGWFTLVCSMDRWTSATLEFESLGGE